MALTSWKKIIFYLIPYYQKGWSLKIPAYKSLYSLCFLAIITSKSQKQMLLSRRAKYVLKVVAFFISTAHHQNPLGILDLASIGIVYQSHSKTKNTTLFVFHFFKQLVGGFAPKPLIYLQGEY